MTENTKCAECGGHGRYTIDGVTLCTSHRGLLSKYATRCAAHPAYEADYCPVCGTARVIGGAV